MVNTAFVVLMTGFLFLIFLINVSLIWDKLSPGKHCDKFGEAVNVYFFVYFVLLFLYLFWDLFNGRIHDFIVLIKPL